MKLHVVAIENSTKTPTDRRRPTAYSTWSDHQTHTYHHHHLPHTHTHTQSDLIRENRVALVDRNHSVLPVALSSATRRTARLPYYVAKCGVFARKTARHTGRA